jgi:hypothetical protein
MPEPLTINGSAMVGWINASGLAKLEASVDKLEVRIWLLGQYTFRPEDVVSVTRVSWTPLLLWGIRIEHSIASYPRQIIFWQRGNPDALLKRIRDAGFEPKAPASAVPFRRGIALRWQALVIAFIVWSVLLQLPQFFQPAKGFASPALVFPLLALVLLFYVSWRTPRSAALQRLVVGDGRHVGEIRPVLNLLAFISGILFCVFTIIVIVQMLIK